MVSSSSSDDPRRDSSLSEIQGSLIHDDISECSVGDATATSLSHESSSEVPVYSELASSISAKQRDISVAFAGMVSKMAVMINEKETENERLLGHDPTESQARRQEQVDKCTMAVSAMAKKQAKLARQFEKLISQLEEQNREKDLERVQLKKQLAEMRDKLNKMKLSSERLSFSGHGPKRTPSAIGIPPRKPVQPFGAPKRSFSFNQKHGIERDNLCNDSTTQATECFSIREISFRSTTVDVEEVVKRMNDDSLSVTSASEGFEGDNVRLLL